MKKVLILFVTLTFFACENGVLSAEDVQNVSFVPTSCSEPWDESPYVGSQSQDSRGSRIVAYLQDKGIRNIYNLKSEILPGEVCKACTCPSGERISFDVNKNDYGKLKKIKPFDNYL